MTEQIYWRQVWGLAALVGATVFCWLAYGFYQPIILTRLGFNELAGWLGILQGLLGAMIEPFAGWLADRYAEKIGRRLPLITIAITLAGLIFIVLSWLLTVHLPIDLRWIVPALMTVWVLAMIIFRGPAMALLVQMAPTKALPQANGILILVFSAVGALGPIFNKIIEWIGAPITFLLGAAILALGRWLLAKETLTPIVIVSQWQKPQYGRMLRVYSLGLLCGLFVNLLLRWSPQQIAGRIVTVEANSLTASILAISALAIFLVRRLVQHWGNGQSIGIAIAAMGVLLSFTPLIATTGLMMGYLLLAGLAFCLLSLAQIPWVLGRFSKQAGLATGLYFGGMGLATAIISVLLLPQT
jgi:MFS family permease